MEKRYFINCKICLKKHAVKRYQLANVKFCSYSCYHKSLVGKVNQCVKNKRIEKSCLVCKSKMSLIPARANSLFCSKKCCGISKLGISTWNKGLKGYKAGESHHWFGKNCTGENSTVWIKDRTKLKVYGEDNLDRRSSAYGNWRKQVWLRDNFKCKIANPDCGGRLEAHHILGFKDHPELRYDINNGITLCHAHHPRKRAEEKRLIPTFRELVSVSKELI